MLLFVNPLLHLQYLLVKLHSTFQIGKYPCYQTSLMNQIKYVFSTAELSYKKQHISFGSGVFGYFDICVRPKIVYFVIIDV